MPAFSPYLYDVTGASLTKSITAVPGGATTWFDPAPGQFQYRVVNEGNVTAWLAIGRTDAEAVNNLASTPLDIPLLPGTVETFSFGAFGGARIYFGAKIIGSGSTTIYITPGAGE